MKSTVQDSRAGYLLVWSRPGVADRVSEPLDRDEALQQFGTVAEIRQGCTPHTGQRLRVVAASEYRGGTR